SKQIAATDADVIGFQEVFSVDALQDLVAAMGYPYFKVVDLPIVVDHAQNVYKSPVVAIASRHPITQADTVDVPEPLLTHLQIQPQFQFSRLPIKATIDLPEVGLTTVYVAHLKSMRGNPPQSAADIQNNLQATTTEKAFAAAQGSSLGTVAALIQRSVEATLIYYDVVEQISLDVNAPVVVMGDMNDTDASLAVQSLSNQYGQFNIGGHAPARWSEEEKLAAHQARLYDSYYLNPNQTGGKRTPTHYYGNEGHVLDYIFVSNAFNRNNSACLAQISDYQVLDEHLMSQAIGNNKQSDHAMLLLELETT
ncbi:MAG: endonuclease/exonuclease/phosphatase family metal-dependent hydrolase, partial [Phenylobacterium sp.]